MTNWKFSRYAMIKLLEGKGGARTGSRALLYWTINRHHAVINILNGLIKYATPRYAMDVQMKLWLFRTNDG